MGKGTHAHPDGANSRQGLRESREMDEGIMSSDFWYYVYVPPPCHRRAQPATSSVSVVCSERSVSAPHHKLDVTERRAPGTR